jgi:hypothetical protein
VRLALRNHVSKRPAGRLSELELRERELALREIEALSDDSDAERRRALGL